MPRATEEQDLVHVPLLRTNDDNDLKSVASEAIISIIWKIQI